MATQSFLLTYYHCTGASTNCLCLRVFKILQLEIRLLILLIVFFASTVIRLGIQSSTPVCLDCLLMNQQVLVDPFFLLKYCYNHLFSISNLYTMINRYAVLVLPILQSCHGFSLQLCDAQPVDMEGMPKVVFYSK